MEQKELYIGGELVLSVDGTTVDVVEAATGDAMGQVTLAGPQDLDNAVDAACSAQAGWAALPGRERAAMLDAFAQALEERAEQTARLVSRQNGMPITLSKGANGAFPAILMRYYAGLVRDGIADETRDGLGRSRAEVVRQAVGVVGAITPWNYPQTLATMKLAPALAAGCAVVLKPPPETALDAFVLAEAADEAGIPPGVLNIVPGDGGIGARLVEHPGVDKVAFTGSTAAGRVIGEVCGRLLKPVTLELGGKSAAILLEDVDLGTYLAKLVRVSLPNAGQTCHSSSRILAPRSRYDEIVEAVTKTVRGLRVGDPLDPRTQVGPLVSDIQRERVLEYIAVGRAEGARLTTGGGIPADQPRGWYVEPTVFADVDNGWRIAQEEIFGPVLCIIPYEDVDEAVAIANDSEFGLAGTIWTADEDRGRALSRRIHTGSIGVNHYGLDPAAPFGGWKASGLGQELGPEGLQAYFKTKSIYLRPAAKGAPAARDSRGEAR